jgi:hypothetical protein
MYVQTTQLASLYGAAPFVRRHAIPPIAEFSASLNVEPLAQPSVTPVVGGSNQEQFAAEPERDKPSFTER